MDLKKWAFDHTLYLKLLEGEPVTCKFLKAEPFVDKEQDDQDKVRYHLEVNGSKKVLESQSIVLAREMAKVKEGDWIGLTRTGKGRQTRYEIEVLKKP